MSATAWGCVALYLLGIPLALVVEAGATKKARPDALIGAGWTLMRLTFWPAQVAAVLLIALVVLVVGDGE